MKINRNLALAAVGIAAAAGITKRFTTNLPGHLMVKHHHYTTYYDIAEHEADSVSWNLTPAMINCTSKPARKSVCARP